MIREFRRRFWLPPRAHGEVIDDRRVSFLELFYDLVYVVVIGRAAHTLAGHVSWQAIGEFAVVFGMVWIAWFNGSLYYELHGREDGRTRTYVFAQMLILAVLAVYTGDAAGDSGRAFAITYAAFLAFIAYFWWDLRKYDAPEYRTSVTRYGIANLATVGVVVASVFVGEGARVVVWAAFVAGWLLVNSILPQLRRAPGVDALRPTDSLVERFGLFTIIVLGEVVVGAVEGMSHSEGDALAIATGVLGLTISFAYWWMYFDILGDKLPRTPPSTLVRWALGHLPVLMAITAVGAAMPTLVEHAHDSRTPAVASWLLGGGVAVGLVAVTNIAAALQQMDTKHPKMRAAIAIVLGAAAVAVAVGALAPPPWILALSLFAILALTWLLTVARFVLLAGARGPAAPSSGK